MRLRYLSFAVLLSLLFAPLSPRAQTSGQLYTATREQLDVTKIVIAQESAWNKGDLDGYLSHFKDAKNTEAILNGPVLGFENIRTAYQRSFPNRESMGQLEQSEVEVRELGAQYALATGKYRLLRSRKAGGEAQGTFTEIFEKTEDGWKLVFSQNS